MSNKLQVLLIKTLKIIPFLFISLWLLLIVWYLVIRYTPLTVWGAVRLSFPQKIPLINNIYLNTIVRPIVTFYPEYEGILTLVYPERELLLDKINFYGNYTYMGTGKIININELNDDQYNIQLVFESGRKRVLSFIVGTSISLKAVKPNEKAPLSDYRLALVDFNKLYTKEDFNKWVTVIWESSNEPTKHFNNNSDAPLNITFLIFMPEWLQYHLYK